VALPPPRPKKFLVSDWGRVIVDYIIQAGTKNMASG